MPSLDDADIVLEGRKFLSRNSPRDVKHFKDLLHSASSISSTTSTPSDLEAAIEVLAYLSLVPDYREEISLALETSTPDSLLLSQSSNETKAAVLVLFLRLSPNFSLSAIDLLELSPDRQLAGAFGFVVALINWKPPKHQCEDLKELQESCMRLFWGLTLPETLFTVGKINLSETNTDSTPISTLTALFNDGMNELISLVLDTDIMSGSIRIIKPWIVSNTIMRTKMRMEVASGGYTSSSLEDSFNGASTASDMDGVLHSYVGFLLRATHNLLLFSTEAQSKLRTHIANGIVIDVFLPYTSMCIAAITAVEDAIGTSDSARALELQPVLQTLLSSLLASFSLLSVASFKIRILRPSLRDGRLIASALQVRSIAQHVPCLAAIFSLTVNADVLLKVESTTTTISSSSSSSSSSISSIKRSKKVFAPRTTATGVSINHTLKSILVSCVDDLTSDDRRRFVKRLKDNDIHAMPTVKSGTSFEHLKDYGWIDISSTTSDSKEGDTSSGLSSVSSATQSLYIPHCAITGRLITDPVIIIAKEGELNPAAGSIYRHYESKDKSSNEGKEAEIFLMYYCEREVIVSAIEDAPVEGVPFTVIECEKDDPVLHSLQRSRLAKLLERQ